MMLDQVCFRTNHLSPSWTLDAYRQVGGYQVLEDILSNKLKPESIIEQIKNSALRGRGGAGSAVLLGGFDVGGGDEGPEITGSGEPIVLHLAVGDGGARPDARVTGAAPA